MTQEMIRGTVEQAYLPSKTTDGKQRPGPLVLTTNIKLAWWPKDEEYPSWIHDVINHFGDYREIIGANIVAMGIKKDFRDGYQQYNIYNLTLIDAETRPTNVSTNIAEKSKPLSSSEGAEKGNAISNATQLIIGYMSTHKGESPTKKWLDQQAELIIYGSESIRGLRKEIEEFENIQTEEIVPSEDSDMPDDTGAIEL